LLVFRHRRCTKSTVSWRALSIRPSHISHSASPTPLPGQSRRTISFTATVRRRQRSLLPRYRFVYRLVFAARARKRSITRLCDKPLLRRTSNLAAAAALRSLPVSLGSRGRCSAAVGLVSVNLSRFLALSYLGFGAFRVADDGAHRT